MEFKIIYDEVMSQNTTKDMFFDQLPNIIFDSNQGLLYRMRVLYAMSDIKFNLTF